MLPLRLDLTVSVPVLFALHLMVAMQLAIDAKQVELLQDGPPSPDLDIGIARVAVEDGRFVCEGLPAWLCGRLHKRRSSRSRRSRCWPEVAAARIHLRPSASPRSSRSKALGVSASPGFRRSRR